MGKKSKAKALKAAKKGKAASSRKTQPHNNKDWKKQKKNLWKKGALEDDLTGMGLRVKHIEPDGNCFFRALGDQLYGNDGDHTTIRDQVLDFIVESRELFEIFIEPCLEDGETFEDYVSGMREPGTWAGDFEVHAASLAFQVDICIFQKGDDGIQCLCNKNPESKKTIHLSYHDGLHYNSVRKSDDYGEGPPELIQVGNEDPQGSMSDRKWTWRDEKHIMENTGCNNEGIVHKFLEENDGAIDLATESVIQWMNENEQSSEKSNSGEEKEEGNPSENISLINDISMYQFSSDEENSTTLFDSNSNGNIAGEYDREVFVCDHGEDPPVSKKAERKKKKNQEEAPVPVKRRPANNKPCPCGSHRKYKACCKIRDAALERQKNESEKNQMDGESVEEVSKKLSVAYI
ncbi:hypothetical protein BSKO_12646 [Bryopsis sp. KO-2023]|nr:hypothetical protein BSKO_12646 [Bryopsis sp. KO-2023]